MPPPYVNQIVKKNYAQPAISFLVFLNSSQMKIKRKTQVTSTRFKN